MLRIASCQFPVSEDIAGNARWIRRFMKRAAAKGADLLHTSEACLSGYAGSDFPGFDAFDWDLLRAETARLFDDARRLRIALVLGSAHFISPKTKPTNCLYVVGKSGRLLGRYDKCFCTRGDQRAYTSGSRLVVRTFNGIRVGFAICYDICFPQLYTAYRIKGVQLMLHSFYNARHEGPNCLDFLNLRQVPTRCADNLFWAVANNSSNPYAHWGSFVARPDAGIARQLPMNRPGMLLHDFPDTLPPGCWIHCKVPMKLAPGEKLHWGRTSRHPRALDGRSKP